jgi:hypothetical protein
MLIVETGSGLSNSESYASVAEADLYHSNRGNTDWDSVDNKEAALRKATDFLTQTYSLKWVGIRKSPTQALDWPRVLATRKNAQLDWDRGYIYYDTTTVPGEVKSACCELALRAASNDLLQDLDRETLSETVYGAVAVTYRPGSSRQINYEAIERILAPLLEGGRYGVSLTRA